MDKGHALAALALLACAGTAAAQQQADPRRADPRIVEYATALSFDLQLQRQQRFCAGDPHARATYEAGLQAFRARNPDFAAVLRTPPAGEEAARAIASVQALIRDTEPAALQGMQGIDIRQYCRTTAQALPTLSWAGLKRQAGLE